MAIIQITDLTFSYPGASAPLFEHVTLNLDTSWRLGLIGRNGRGKTTFLKLLLGKLHGTGSVYSPEVFEYFPVEVADVGQTALAAARGAIAPFDKWEAQKEALALMGTDEAMEEYGEIEHAYVEYGGYTIDEAIAVETGKLGIHPDVLRRPLGTLSGGEKVKLLLASLFLKKHRFLLIDEPTDHLDAEGRRTVARWLATKSGFILISHDRAFLDEAVDHILSVNRADIELQKGNYSSWRQNRTLQDEFEKAENRRLEADIGRLKEAAKRTENWSDKIEKSKTSGAKNSYNGGTASLDRGYVGHQAARMMQRSKAIEKRRGREIEQKQTLLKNVEEAEPLRFLQLQPDKKRLVTAEEISLSFGQRILFSHLSFSIDEGERIAVTGANGCGKSTLLQLVLGTLSSSGGTIRRHSGLVISSLPQETGFLQGSLLDFANAQDVPEPLFLALLRKLDFEREAFTKDMAAYSAGQKKKVCLAASLAKPAHLFVWDEPLNYIDVLSREQIEAAVLESGPTMLFVEHDAAFVDKVATNRIAL